MRRRAFAAHGTGLEPLSMPLLLASLPLALFLLGLRVATGLYRRRQPPAWTASAALTEVVCVVLVSLLAVGAALLAAALATVLRAGDRPIDVGSATVLVAAALLLWWRLPRPQPPRVPLSVVEGGGGGRAARAERRPRPTGRSRAA